MSLIELAHDFVEGGYTDAEALDGHSVVDLARPGWGEALVEVEIVLVAIADADRARLDGDVDRALGVGQRAPE